LQIRPATTADAPVLLALEREAPTAAHWSPRQYESALQSSERLVLVLDEGPSTRGFLVARVTGREWELENIVIAPQFQRQGHGMHLLRELLSHAGSQDAESITLEIRESNLAAQALYKKCGFSPVGRRPRYYREPEEDALIYRLVPS
jgi:ribosomal-protein-alanine N-acetyltransferase